eukprot:93266-Ditylum_brightwellii.AAC.1
MSAAGNGPANNDKQCKQQGGKPLPFLYHDFHGYTNTEWYQWELTVQILTKGATQMNSANDVGTEFKAFLVKVFATHKNMTNVLTENKQCLEVETFPKGAKEVKDLLAYKTTESCYRNVTMIIHVTGLIPYSTFKSKMFNYLKMNNIYLNMAIFHNTKETVTKIGHITNTNPTKIYKAACQENLNNALSVVASELNKEDA